MAERRSGIATAVIYVLIAGYKTTQKLFYCPEIVRLLYQINIIKKPFASYRKF